MKELFYQLYLPTVFSLELLAALTGVFYYKKYKHTIVKYFVWFLVFTFVQDTISQVYTKIYKNFFFEEYGMIWLVSNHWWYTLFWDIASSCFYLFYFSLILKTKRNKKILKIAAILFAVSALGIITFNFEHFIWHSFISIDMLNALAIFLCVSMYFIEVLSSNKILDFYKSFNFYVSVVIMLWWLVITPLVFYNHFYYYGQDDAYKLIQLTVYFCANLFMYLSFILLLILYKPNKELMMNKINL